MHLPLYIFLLTLYGAAGFFLVGAEAGYSEAKQEGTASIQMILLATGITSIALVARSAEARRLLRQCAPLLWMCALAFLSAIWSIDPWFTVRKAYALSACMLLGIALVAALGSKGTLDLFARSLAVTCLLSLLAVVLWPTLAIHQAADGYELNHDGLWRGVLGHKVSLGMFAGLTLAVLATPGGYGFASGPARLAAAAIALVCLIGSGSATGIAAAIVYVALFIAGRRLSTLSPALRYKVVRAAIVALLLVGYAVYSGTLDQWAGYLGRSGDLTGRALYWPHVTAFVERHSWHIGFGYAAGYRFVGPLIADVSGNNFGEAHNGTIEMLVAFGYLGAVFVVGIHVWLFVRACRLLAASGAALAPSTVFPAAAMGTVLIVSYAESVILMPTGVWTLVFAIATAVTARHELEAQGGERQADADRSLAGVPAAIRPGAYP